MSAQLIARLTLRDGNGNRSLCHLRCGAGRELVATLATKSGTPESWSNLQIRESLPAFWRREGGAGGRISVAKVVAMIRRGNRRIEIVEVSPSLPSGFVAD